MVFSKAAARTFVFFSAGFLSYDSISKSEGHFNSKHGGNYVVDIVHIC